MSERQYDVNGWYEINRNPISRAGVFPYTAKSIGAPGWQEDPNRIVSVYRPEDELAHPDTVASARLVPWIDDHTMLGDPDMDPGLTPPEQAGIQGTTGEKIEYDPASRTLFANLKMFGRQLQHKIDAGKKELSMGFRCVYEHTSGIFEGQPFEAIQRGLRFNHNASVDAGRMGPGVAVMDGIERFAFDESEVREIEMKPTVRTKLAALMGVSVAALDAAIADPVKLKAALDAEAKEEAAAADPGSAAAISAAAEEIQEIAGPMSDLVDAISAMGGGSATDPENPDMVDTSTDDMEPVTDAAGNQVMENGKPKMKKKAAAVDATAPAIAAMDAALKIMKTRRASIKTGDCTALDASIKTAEDSLAKVKTIHAARSVPRVAGGDAALEARMVKLEGSMTALDGATLVRSALKEVGQRDILAKGLSNFVGAFDASEMTLAQVGEYGNEKLKLNAPKGQELGAVQGYIAARTSAPALVTATDAAPATGRVAEYLNGTAAA